MLDWLDIVKRNKIKERYAQRDTLAYTELAELYFEAEDYENAENMPVCVPKVNADRLW